MKFSDFRQKEVINSCDCKVLGSVCDIIFNPCNGVIEAIIIPGPAKVCGFFCRDSEYVIPWKCIKKIGEDIILVEINEEEALHKSVF